MKKIIFIIMVVASNCWGGRPPIDIKQSNFSSSSRIPVRYGGGAHRPFSKISSSIDDKPCSDIYLQNYNKRTKIQSYIKHHKEHPEEKIDPEKYLEILKDLSFASDECNRQNLKPFLDIYYLCHLNNTLLNFFNRDSTFLAVQFIEIIFQHIKPEDFQGYTGKKGDSISENRLEKIWKKVYCFNLVNLHKWWDSEWYRNFKETNSLLEETLYNILKRIKTHKAQIESIQQISKNLEQNIETREGRVYYTKIAAIDPQEYLEILNNFNLSSLDDMTKYCLNGDPTLKPLIDIYYSNEFNEPLMKFVSSNIDLFDTFIIKIINQRSPEDLKGYDGEKVGSLSLDRIVIIVKDIIKHKSYCNKWWDSAWYKNFKETNSLLEETLYRILKIIQISYASHNNDKKKLENESVTSDSLEAERVLSLKYISVITLIKSNDIQKLENKEIISFILQKNMSILKNDDKNLLLENFLNNIDKYELFDFFRRQNKENIETFLDTLKLKPEFIIKLPKCEAEDYGIFCDYELMVKLLQIDIKKFKAIKDISIENNLITEMCSYIALYMEIQQEFRKYKLEFKRCKGLISS